MKNNVRTLTVTLVLLFLCVVLEAQVGFYVNNGRLYDANNNEFVIRGVSHAHCWYTKKTSALADIKSVGANAVRIVLSSGEHGEGWPRNEPSDVQNIVNLCKQNRLVAILECHDTTGYGEKDGAVPLSTAVNYWRNLQGVLTGEEGFVLINIGNEPYGNTNASAWVNDTINAIQSMRSAGFDHTIVVDAPNWGQDWEHIMRDNAQSIYNADSTGNLVLSIHMYGVYEKDAAIDSYISAIRGQNLPLIIGEFGWDHSDGNPDEDAIMHRAEEYNIGYIGWSWCGNSGGVEYLDMVSNWDVNSLTSWGDRIVNGANGLQSKSGECSIYSGASVTPPTGPDPTEPPPSAGSCANVPVWTATDVYDQTGTRVQYNCLVYENNWYSKDQNPGEFSDEFEVWTFIGMCDDCGTTPDPATPTPTPEVTPDPTAIPTDEPTPVSQCQGETGDMNSDGVVDIIDALLAAQWYTGLLISPPPGYYCSDVNCSGEVDIVDALLIAQYYVGIIVNFPC